MNWIKTLAGRWAGHDLVEERTRCALNIRRLRLELGRSVTVPRGRSEVSVGE